MAKPYFKPVDTAPPPLRTVAKQTVRFDECDPLGIVWHGRYTSYFEDARVALGNQYGIGYMDFFDRGISTPLKQMHHDYIKPLRFQDHVTTEGILHWSEAARLNFEFIIRNESGDIATRGYTVQLMLDTDFEVLLSPPAFYLDFCDKWKAGTL
ncbi:thioesterase [bacterium F16]|nr:thioesterase [bacterium F16]